MGVVVVAVETHLFRQASDTHTHMSNGPFYGTIRVSRYQKGKTNPDFTGARDSEWQWQWQWAICKSAPCSKQITTPAPHHSVFYRPDALPATQPTSFKTGDGGTVFSVVCCHSFYDLLSGSLSCLFCYNYHGSFYQLLI